LSHIVLLRPRTIPKTSSGKIARSWCRKAFVAKKLSSIYEKSYSEFKTTQDSSDEKRVKAFEIEQNKVVENSTKGADVRKLDKEIILGKLLADISRITADPVESIDKDAPLVTVMDSLSLSQFKGMLENEYAVKISDEYVFRDTTTSNKLVEIVRLGYARDDNPDGEVNLTSNTSAAQGNSGFAQSLGCPPGVVCCSVM